MTARVVLVGLPGAGKSTTGRRLAKILCVPFADSDDLVEARAGRSVRDIFATDGEAAFRALEAEAVADALTGFDGVLSLGGGAVLHPPTRAALVASAAASAAAATALTDRQLDNSQWMVWPAGSTQAGALLVVQYLRVAMLVCLLYAQTCKIACALPPCIQNGCDWRAAAVYENLQGVCATAVRYQQQWTGV